MADLARNEDVSQTNYENNNNSDNEDDNNISWLFESFTPVAVNSLKMTNVETVVRVYQMARTLDRILNQRKIRYWTSGGTTLGIVRHGGLIPWDDDVDICIMEQDEALLSSLDHVFFQEGYTLQRHKTYSWKLFPTLDSNSIPNEHYSHRYPFTDIFVTSKKGTKLRIRDQMGRNAWPNEYYAVKDILYSFPRAYGDFTLNCPLHPEEYLDRTYGAGWRIKGETHNVCHKTGGILNNTQFILEEKMYTPALPFK